jgi:anti-sigma B factor antagonist
MSGVVKMQGRITIDNSGQMRSLLGDAIRSASGKVTVNLSAVTYMDVSGLATLLEAMRISKELNKELVLQGIQEQPRYLFKVTDLDHLFEIEEGVEG